MQYVIWLVALARWGRDHVYPGWVHAPVTGAPHPQPQRRRGQPRAEEAKRVLQIFKQAMSTRAIETDLSARDRAQHVGRTADEMIARIKGQEKRFRTPKRTNKPPTHPTTASSTKATTRSYGVRSSRSGLLRHQTGASL